MSVRLGQKVQALSRRGGVNEGLNATIFYVSVAALVGGMVRTLRASIERNARDRAGIVIAACGAAGLIVAIVAFVTGPKTLLPF